jgi:hypothetical protein
VPDIPRAGAEPRGGSSGRPLVDHGRRFRAEATADLLRPAFDVVPHDTSRDADAVLGHVASLGHPVEPAFAAAVRARIRADAAFPVTSATEAFACR